MGLFDGVFAPNTGWLGLQPTKNDQTSPLDISALIQAFGGGGMPQGPYGMQSAPMLNGNMPIDNRSVTTQGDANALTGAYPNNPAQWVRPGSPLDRMSELFTDPFGSKNPFPGALGAPKGPSTNPADYAGLADAFGGGQLPPNARPTSGVAPAPSPQGPTLDERAYGTPGPQSSQTPMQSAPIGGAPQSPQIPPQAAQAMAQAPQFQKPETGIGDRLAAGFQGFAHSGGALPALSNLIGGFATGQRQDKEGRAQQNQQVTMQAVAQSLIARGYSPQEAIGMAQAASIDPKVAERVLGEAYAIPKTAEELAVRRASMPGSGQGQGNPFDILKQKSAAVKAGETQGERTGNAELDYPTAVAQGKEALRLAGEIRNHKGREGNVWWHNKLGNYLPDSSIPGNTDAGDAVNMLNQVKGGAFLEAFKTLKGGGQITEVEGKKATDAIARMQRHTSKAEFDKALSDYEGIIKLGVDRASQLAGKEAPNQFKGNSDWQQVKPGIRIRQVQ